MSCRKSLILGLAAALCAGMPATGRCELWNRKGSEPPAPYPSTEFKGTPNATTITAGQTIQAQPSQIRLKTSENAATARASAPLTEKQPVVHAASTAPQPAAVALPAPGVVRATLETPATAASQQSPDAKRRDEMLLLARTLQEAGVVRADNEEYLPPAAPPAAPPAGENKPENHLTADYVGEPYCAPCCPPPRPLFWVAGVEATFLWPDLNRQGSVFSLEEEEWEETTTFSSFDDSIDSMYVSPRVWVGVQGCKWGANVRYWHLQACEGQFRSSLDNDEDAWEFDEWAWDAAPSIGAFSNSRLEAYTIDLELTRRFCLHDCAMQASFGVRHGSIAHHESIAGSVLGDEARFTGYARSDRYSHGTGVVMGLYGRKPLFPCSCVHWFYNARWSALWGPSGTSAETFAAVMVDGGNAGSVNGARTRVGDTLFIGEIQLGIEWNYALRCLPANAFFRAAVEYQRWDGGRGFSDSNSFAGFTDSDDFTTTLSTFASADEPQMDLVGITLGTGLTW